MDARDKQNAAAVAIVVVMLAAGYWLVTTLHRQDSVEDCLLAHRRDCDQLLSR